MSNKKLLWSVLRLSIAGVILYYLFTHIPLSGVLAAVTSARADYLIAASIVSILVQLIVGYRLKFFTDNQGLTLSVSQVLEVNFTTVFYGLFLPGGNVAGGAIRFYRLAKQDKKMTEALASLAFDRMTATVALCVVGIFFWLINLPSSSDYIGLSMIAVLGALALVHLWLFHGRTPLPLGTILGWLHRSFVSAKMQKLLTSLKRYRDLSLGSLASNLAVSIMTQLMGTLVYYVLALSLGLHISFVTLAWVRSAVVLLTMIPISMSGLGMREGALVFLLKPYGVGGEEALALSLLVFAVTVLMIGVIGGLLEGRRFLLPDPRGVS